MKKLLFILTMVVARGAFAQQGFQDPMADFEARRDQMHRDFEERVAEDNREFEAARARGEHDFRVTAFVMFGGFFAFVLILFALGARRRRTMYSETAEYSPPVDAADVSVLRIAIDARTSKFVRDEMARIDKLADATTPGGRLTRLRELGVLLRRVRDAWVYGGAVNEPMRSVPESMAVFRKHVDDARTRLTKAGGSGVLLISIVVVARGELATVSSIGAGEELRRALEAAAYRAPDELLALDVIASPEVSSMQLETIYPAPDLYPIQGALVGKTFCTYCGGPFPAELVSCPHCGAPAPGRDRAAA
jgi:uncharacterized membrane protein